MKKHLFLLVVFLALPFWAISQKYRWISDNTYFVNERGEVVQYTLPEGTRTVVVARGNFPVKNFIISPDKSKLLLFINTKKVWRLETRGDYVVFDISSKQSKKIGSTLAASSLMFAKFSPDNTK